MDIGLQAQSIGRTDPMKTYSLMILLSSLVFIPHTPASAIQVECIGNGGPKPLIVSSSPRELRPIQTAGSIQEFTFWENSNLLLYRNDWNGLYDAHPDCGLPRYYGPLQDPLSRVVDSAERFLLVENQPRVRDLTLPNWYSFGAPTPLRHLFWHKNFLYSASLITRPDHWQELQILRYKPGAQKAATVCQPLYFEKNEKVQLAEGHAYPYVYFYNTSPQNDGSHTLTMYALNIGMNLPILCGLFNLDGITWKMPAPIKNVHKFPTSQAILIEADHPEKRLWWAPKEKCGWVNTGPATVMVTNHRLPLIFLWSSGEGLSLYDLKENKSTQLLSSNEIDRESIASIHPSNLFLTSDARRLYLAPLLESDGKQHLYELKLVD